jgi:enoyl-CoA hydratase/carnithine racemase
VEALLTSRDYTAEEAERLGWINKALPPSELDTYVDDLALRIADFPGYAIAATKKVINANLPELDFAPELDGFVEALLHPDAIRIVNASVEAGLQRSIEDEWDMPALCAKARKMVRNGKS